MRTVPAGAKALSALERELGDAQDRFQELSRCKCTLIERLQAVQERGAFAAAAELERLIDSCASQLREAGEAVSGLEALSQCAPAGTSPQLIPNNDRIEAHDEGT